MPDPPLMGDMPSPTPSPEELQKMRAELFARNCVNFPSYSAFRQWVGHPLHSPSPENCAAPSRAAIRRSFRLRQLRRKMEKCRSVSLCCAVYCCTGTCCAVAQGDGIPHRLGCSSHYTVSCSTCHLFFLCYKFSILCYIFRGWSQT